MGGEKNVQWVWFQKLRSRRRLMKQEVANKQGMSGFPWVLKRADSYKIFKVSGYKNWLKELLTRFEKETCRILWAQEEAEVKNNKKKKKSQHPKKKRKPKSRPQCWMLPDK